MVLQMLLAHKRGGGANVSTLPHKFNQLVIECFKILHVDSTNLVVSVICSSSIESPILGQFFIRFNKGKQPIIALMINYLKTVQNWPFTYFFIIY